jgi:hypothetical protein
MHYILKFELKHPLKQILTVATLYMYVLYKQTASESLYLCIAVSIYTYTSSIKCCTGVVWLCATHSSLWLKVPRVNENTLITCSKPCFATWMKSYRSTLLQTHAYQYIVSALIQASDSFYQNLTDYKRNRKSCSC